MGNGYFHYKKEDKSCSCCSNSQSKINFFTIPMTMNYKLKGYNHLSIQDIQFPCQLSYQKFKVYEQEKMAAEQEKMAAENLKSTKSKNEEQDGSETENTSSEPTEAS